MACFTPQHESLPLSAQSRTPSWFRRPSPHIACPQRERGPSTGRSRSTLTKSWQRWPRGTGRSDRPQGDEPTGGGSDLSVVFCAKTTGTPTWAASLASPPRARASGWPRPRGKPLGWRDQSAPGPGRSATGAGCAGSSPAHRRTGGGSGPLAVERRRITSLASTPSGRRRL